VCVFYRINPTDEEGKSRTPEKMTELVQEAHQAHTKKALNGLQVQPPLIPCPQPPRTQFTCCMVCGLDVHTGLR
jgi:hypothetical protein